LSAIVAEPTSPERPSRSSRAGLPLLDKVAAVARAESVYVNAAIGVPFERNETYLVAPDGREQSHYRKNQPVPGLEPVAPFVNDAPVVQTPFGRLSNVICYDGDFPTLIRISRTSCCCPVGIGQKWALRTR
jgi:apolipoprotein N-acyltransferase